LGTAARFESKLAAASVRPSRRALRALLRMTMCLMALRNFVILRMPRGGRLEGRYGGLPANFAAGEDGGFDTRKAVLARFLAF
jgi:hypothetical protein